MVTKQYLKSWFEFNKSDVGHQHTDPRISAHSKQDRYNGTTTRNIIIKLLKSKVEWKSMQSGISTETMKLILQK